MCQTVYLLTNVIKDKNEHFLPFLAGTKDQLFNFNFPSVPYTLPPSFPEADICYMKVAIAITRERVVVQLKVRK